MNKLYWVWLGHVLGPGNPWAGEVLRSGLSPRELYQNRAQAAALLEGLPESLQRRFAQPALNLEKGLAEKWRARVKESGVKVLTPESPDYPSLLRNLAAPPLALYVWGDSSLLRESLCVGLVGPRKATAYGEEAARSIARDLTSCGVHPVSGHAVGIDSAVHEGALSAGGGSVMVLACGHDRDYPAGSMELRRRVAREGGLVISETLPGEPFQRNSFEQRNRLLAGLCMGVVVVEAGEKSGALNTARQAAEQGKDLFCVTGSIFEPNQAGVAKLLREGARPVTGAADILAEYFPLYPERIEEAALRALGSGITRRSSAPKPEEKPRTPELSFLPEESQKIVQRLEKEKAHIDELTAYFGENSGKALAALTELEILGLVQSLPGGYYKRI